MQNTFKKAIDGVTYRFHAVNIQKPGFLSQVQDKPPVPVPDQEQEEAKIEQCLVGKVGAPPFVPQQTGGKGGYKGGGGRGGSKPRFTHFLSLPLRPSKEGVAVLKEFHKSIEESKISDYNPKWVKDISTMHFTLLMLSFPNEAQVKKAVDLLQDLRTEMLEILGGQELKLPVKGLGVFGRVGRARVVYAKTDQSTEAFNRLELLTTMLISKFMEHELATSRNLDHIKFNEKRQLYDVEYHMTLINCKYGKGPYAMDATEVLQNWKGKFDLGNVSIPELHLSTLGKYDETGFYFPQTRVSLLS